MSTRVQPVLRGSLTMDQLATLGVNPGLPKTEFIHLLISHPVLVFFKCDLIPSELTLVNRRDTALRLVGKVLS